MKPYREPAERFEDEEKVPTMIDFVMARIRGWHVTLSLGGASALAAGAVYDFTGKLGLTIACGVIAFVLGITTLILADKRTP